MDNSKLHEDFGDYYAVNSDFSGTRDVAQDHQEAVAFRESSYMRIWYNDIPANYDTHWHSALEIIMPVENWYEINIKNVPFHIEPGQILFVPPGELHEVIAPTSGKRFIFMFDINQLTGIKGFSGIQSLLATPLFVSKEKYPHIYEDVYQTLVQMRNEYFNNNEYGELTIYAQLINMLVKFGYNHISTTNLFPNVRLYKQKEYVQKFNDLLDYIDHHYMEELSLEQVADNIGFSKFHFSRLFKQYTTFTFCDYLCYRRIKAAEELLILPDYSITEVALQSGFPSISTFNRIFKQQKGCTPSEYRSKNNRNLHR